MLCLACHTVARGSLCPQCRLTILPATDRLLTGGVRLVPAFEHVGAARELIHHLKYRGIGGYAELVAATVARRLPQLPVTFVPRAASRHLKYGVDAARLIAWSLARRLDSEVAGLLQPHVHTRRRAGHDHTDPVRLNGPSGPLPRQVILVDDVYTTGATVEAAIRSLGSQTVGAVVVANVVPELSSLPLSD